MPESSSRDLAGELPTLIGLGPIRSGTTWVHEMLFGHSQVATTLLKEVNFFNSNFERGPTWYAQQFRPTTAATRLRADISPFYLMDAAVCERIARTVANPILMVNLRSPYERVLSWYQKYRQEELPIGWIASDPEVHYEAQVIGHMASTLQHYIDRFGRDRLIIVDYADLKRDPVGLAERLQRRLGLDIETPPSIEREVNASVHYRSAALRRLAHMAGPLVRKLSPELFYKLKFGLLHDVIFAKQRITGPTAAEKIAALGSLREAFEADIDQLEKMLGRDLSHWRYEAQVAALQPVETAGPAAPAARPRGLAAAFRRAALEARTVWSLGWDPKVPLRARIASLAVASYLVTPLDIIPNRIPVIGHLDEAVTIPLALALFLWLSPQNLVRRHRDQVRQARTAAA